MKKIRTAIQEHVSLTPFDPHSKSFLFTDASYLGFEYILIRIDENDGL